MEKTWSATPSCCVGRLDGVSMCQALRKVGVLGENERLSVVTHRSERGHFAGSEDASEEKKVALPVVVSRFLRAAGNSGSAWSKRVHLAEIWNALLALVPSGDMTTRDIPDVLGFLLEGLALFFFSGDVRTESCRAVDRIFCLEGASSDPGQQGAATFLKWACVMPECISACSRLLVTLLDQETCDRGWNTASQDAHLHQDPLCRIEQLLQLSMTIPGSTKRSAPRNDVSWSNKLYNLRMEMSETNSIAASPTSVVSADATVASRGCIEMLGLLSPNLLEWSTGSGSAVDARAGEVFCDLHVPELNTLRLAAGEGLGIFLALFFGLRRYLSSFMGEDSTTSCSEEGRSGEEEGWKNLAPGPCLDQRWTRHALEKTESCLAVLCQGICNGETVEVDGPRGPLNLAPSQIVSKSFRRLFSLCKDLLRAPMLLGTRQSHRLGRRVAQSRTSVLITCLIDGCLHEIRESETSDSHYLIPLTLSFLDDENGKLQQHSWQAIHSLAKVTDLKTLQEYSSSLHLALWRHLPPRDCSDTHLDAYFSAATSLLIKLHPDSTTQLFLESIDRFARLIPIQFVGTASHLSISLHHAKALVEQAGELVAFSIREWLTVATKALESPSSRAVLSGLGFVAELLRVAPICSRYYLKDILFRLFLVHLTFLAPPDTEFEHKPCSPLRQSFLEIERQELQSLSPDIRCATASCLTRLRRVAGHKTYVSLLLCIENVTTTALLSAENDPCRLRQEIANFRREAIKC